MIYKCTLHNQFPFLRHTHRGSRGLDRMVIGFITTYAISGYHHLNCWFESRSYIAEIFLKVALNTIKPNQITHTLFHQPEWYYTIIHRNQKVLCIASFLIIVPLSHNYWIWSKIHYLGEMTNTMYKVEKNGHSSFNQESEY